MRKVLTVLTAIAVVGVLFSVDAQPVQARKQYMDEMKAKYSKVATEVDAQKCGVCHGKNKKQRSDYAKALEKAIGGKNEKDSDKVKEAFDKVADQEYADGKKYGELLKDGKLPAPFSE